MQILRSCTRLFLFSFLLNLTLTAQSTATAQQELTLQVDPALAKDVNASLPVVNQWLSFIDHAKYNEGWDAASKKMQLTVPKGEWTKVVNSRRQPLGSIIQRNLADIRVADNPPNMPAGRYLVYVYETAFRNKSGVIEVLILLQNNTGDWKILSYDLK